MFENSNLTQYSNAIKTKEQIMLSDFEKNEKKHHLTNDGKGDAFAQQVALPVKLHKVGELVLILVNGKAVCETAFADWQAQNSSVIDELQKIIECLPAEQGQSFLNRESKATLISPACGTLSSASCSLNILLNQILFRKIPIKIFLNIGKSQPRRVMAKLKTIWD